MLHSNVTLLPSITAYERFDISTIGKSKTKKKLISEHKRNCQE